MSDHKLNTACNAWHIDSLERLKSRIGEVLPLVNRRGAVYCCQPELARRISVSGQRLLTDVETFLKAAEEKSKETKNEHLRP